MTVDERVSADDWPEDFEVLTSGSTAEPDPEALTLNFTPVDASTIDQLKTLNRVIFPVKYQVTMLASRSAS